jgi:hypothetical protein
VSSDERKGAVPAPAAPESSKDPEKLLAPPPDEKADQQVDFRALSPFDQTWHTVSEALTTIGYGSRWPPTDAGPTEPDLPMLDSEDPVCPISA